MFKYFYLPRKYDPKRGQKTINDLNNLLNEVGVSFSVSKDDKGQQLDISVDEEKLHSVIKNKSGRPIVHEFDIEKIQQMKKKGLKNKEIYTELGMSKALFYMRMKEHKMKNK